MPITRERAVGWAAVACAAASVASLLGMVGLALSPDRSRWETRLVAGVGWCLIGGGGLQLVRGRPGRWPVFVGAALAAVVVLSELVNIATRPPVEESGPVLVVGVYLLVYLGLALAVLWLRDGSDEHARGE